MKVQRIAVGALILLLVLTGSLRAQMLVYDPANTAEVATTVDKVLSVLEMATKTLEWHDRAQQALAGITRYRTSPIAAVRHEVERFPYGGDFLDIFNTSDPRGVRYMRNMRKLAAYGELMTRLPPEQRVRMAQKIAMREIADSIGQRGGHVVGQVRQNDATVKGVLLEIEDAIMNPRTAMHYQTAVMEKGNALALANAKQVETQNIVLSQILEHKTYQTKREEDGMISVLNQQLNNLDQAPVKAAENVAGTTDAIRGFVRLF